MNMEAAFNRLRRGRIVQNSIHLLLGSVGRFLILVGALLLFTGYIFVDGILAGHLGIYGVSALVLGVFIRLIWFIRD
jgi:hypothetical protein